jgi:hypothetical protein
MERIWIFFTSSFVTSEVIGSIHVVVLVLVVRLPDSLRLRSRLCLHHRIREYIQLVKRSLGVLPISSSRLARLNDANNADDVASYAAVDETTPEFYLKGTRNPGAVFFKALNFLQFDALKVRTYNTMPLEIKILSSASRGTAPLGWLHHTIL